MSVLSGLCDSLALMRQAQQYLREVAVKRQAQDADPSAAGAGLLCQTTSGGNYPTQAQAVYIVTPVELDAEDDEGATATPSPDTEQNFFAVNVGSQVPPAGTLVICHAVGGRWCFQFDG